MAWVRIDDQLSDHPKIVSAGPDAAWLYISGLCYAARYLTDGFIPEAQVRRLSDIKNSPAAAKRLVSNGLWDAVEGGYQVHDYLDYNDDADTVKTRRKRNADRQSKWRDKGVSNAVSNASHNDMSNEQHNSVTNAVTNGAVIMPQTQTPIRESNDSLAMAENPGRKPREPDPHFETFVRLFEYDAAALNDSERGKLNRAVKLVKQNKGSPEDIEMAYEVYPAAMPPGTKRTVIAVANNFQDLILAARTGQNRVLTSEEMYRIRE